MPDVFDWRTAVAQRVCTLVRDERVRNAFQAQCAAFIDEIDRDEERLIAWRKRRKEHCLRGSHTLAELKARTVDGERLDKNPEALERTRPAEDTDKRWIFDYYQDHLDLEDLARLGSPTGEPMLVGFCVWVPPDLSLAASPKLTAPLLFARFMGASAVPTLLTLPELWRLTGTLHSSLGTTVEPGRASWAEKYASLAAIHDAQFPDRAPIDELHYINAGKLTNELRRRARQRVRQFVDALPDAVSTNVLEWLADVEADLAEYLEPLGQPNPTGGEQDSNGKSADEEMHEEAHQGASSMGASKTRWLNRVADCVHEDTRDPRYRERYVQMTRTWADRMARDGRWRGIRLHEFLRQEHPDWTDDEIENEVRETEQKYGGIPMKFRRDAIAVTTHRTTPLDKKYATLAAIHDALHECDYQLSPWKGEPFRNPFREGATEKDAEDLASWNFYRFLREDVAKLTYDDRPGIERILKEVSADLEHQIDGKGAASGRREDTTPAGSASATDVASHEGAAPKQVARLPVEKATLAKAILFERPDISPTELANQVGVSRGTLYSRSPKWIDVRRTLVARNDAEVVKGTKSADGELEADADCREFHPTDEQ